MPEVSATEAARNFADLLDAVEHRGAEYTIVRRGKVVAHLEPVTTGKGSQVKQMLTRHGRDAEWTRDLEALRELLVVEDRR
ncbi:MAG: type II toxin-antitoxin system Phd/YefM family antitoxin [Actinobacteria bacterium]|nr:MAG: type II toxin-antitoxin system Phd/YefM family antitoxin [Actinomycetota bacterium]RIK04565.1 MAG: prevent-host-death family protein [Acidobacteriota bacterium]